MLEVEIVDDEEMNALGRWCDEHRDEIDAQCEESKRRGETYTIAELGAENAFEAARIVRKMKANGTFGKFRTPYHAEKYLKTA